jgi:hypothetical protein
MKSWDYSTFQGFLGQRVDWILVTGNEYSGKDMVAVELGSIMKSKVVNMLKMSEEVKKSLGTEDEPFEGDVPISKVEQAIYQMIEADRVKKDKYVYIFDGFMHETVE